MTKHSSSPAHRGVIASDANLHTPSSSLASTNNALNPPSYTTSRGKPIEGPGYEEDTMYPVHPSRTQSHQPLLSDGKGERSPSGEYETTRPSLSMRHSTFRSQNPKFTTPEDSAKKKYIYAAICLLISLVSFVVQTETAVYIQHELKWNKAFCMLWLTHSSWMVLWPTQLIFLRIQKRNLPWSAFWRRHKALVTSTAQMVRRQDIHLSPSTTAENPWPFMIKMIMFVTTFLTFAGASWYIAVDLTSPSDLTAIYNCSAFFAYVFSILLLNDAWRWDKMFSVALAIVGVLVVAYGDSEETKSPGHSGGSTNPNPDSPPNNRLLGNLIIGVGSVLYGLYEVLYKKYACPPEGTSPHRTMVFANTVGSMVGTFTFTVLWIPIPILHFTGLERFELPSREAAGLLFVSTLSNATFSGAFLVLMSLTSPVLSSVAALLTIFLVAITDWFLTGKPLSLAAISGGTLIIVAFLMLAWATYREMQQHAKKLAEDDDKPFDEDDSEADVVFHADGEYREDEGEFGKPGPGFDKRSRRDS